MGEHVANSEAGFIHAHGTDPFTHDVETSRDPDVARIHWGDEGIDESDTVNATQRAALKTAALVSQSAFNTTAAPNLDWYPSAWSGLGDDDQTLCEELTRYAWAQT